MNEKQKDYIKNGFEDNSDLKGTIGERFYGSGVKIFPHDFSKHEFQLVDDFFDWRLHDKLTKEEAIKKAKEKGYNDYEIERALPFTRYANK